MKEPTPTAWMRALCNGTVVGLYAPNAVLVPTYEAMPLRGRAAIFGYMKKFIEGKPGLCGTIDTMLVEQLDCDVKVFSGLYTFHWGKGEHASARYTFVVTPRGIATQHSSAMP